ncbi:MAG TPA: hypothetical protein V6D19_19905 [Stenomitos sp.]
MSDKHNLQAELNEVNTLIHQLVERCEGEPTALLKILRLLEALHFRIRENHFQPALPVHRHELYALLREIEAEGGWPYIPRMQLKAFLTTEESFPDVDHPSTHEGID